VRFVGSVGHTLLQALCFKRDISMFSQKSKNLLENMRIDSGGYYQILAQKFGNDVQIFCKLIDVFDCAQKVNGTAAFNQFWSSEFPTYSHDGELYFWAFEFYNNLKRYFSGGVFNLFKEKQAEWGAPIIKIRREDVPSQSSVHELDESIVIYRGLSKLEYECCEYAQSWTIKLSEAKRFATEIYSDEKPGIVVQASITRDRILFYDMNDSEQEVIIENGAVKFATEIQET